SGGCIDHDHAGLGSTFEVRGFTQVRSADPCGEAKFSVVGYLRRLFIVSDLDDGSYRAEDLFLVNPHLVRGAGDQGGFHKIALGGCRDALSTVDIAAFSFRNVEVLEITVQLVGANHGPDHRLSITSIPDNKVSHPRFHFLYEFIVNVSGHDEPGRGGAS